MIFKKDYYKKLPI